MGKTMVYNLTPMPINKEAARFETCVRGSQGYKLDITNLGRNYLPSLAPIYVDYANEKAYPIVNVVVNEAYISNSTTPNTVLKIKKGSGVAIGMFLGNGTNGCEVSAIDKSNTAYDKLTLTTDFKADLAMDTVIFQTKSDKGVTQKYKANQLNYAPTKNEAGATVTGILSIYEIQTSKIDYPFSAKDKEDLGARFQFIN
ncbi:MAG: head fiber protein [Bacteroidales bacterium]